MSPTRCFTRRAFLSSVVLSAVVPRLGAAEPAKRSKIIGFIKPFQKLSYAEIAQISADIGWDGIECPVRKGGSIEPAAVEEELPKLVDALRKNNLECAV